MMRHMGQNIHVNITLTCYIFCQQTHWYESSVDPEIMLMEASISGRWV